MCSVRSALPGQVQGAVENGKRAAKIILQVAEGHVVVEVELGEGVRLSDARSPAGGAQIAAHQAVPVELAQTKNIDLEKPGEEHAQGNHDREHRQELDQVNVTENLPVEVGGMVIGGDVQKQKVQQGRGAENRSQDKQQAAGPGEQFQAELLVIGSVSRCLAAVAGEQSADDRS